MLTLLGVLLYIAPGNAADIFDTVCDLQIHSKPLSELTIIGSSMSKKRQSYID
jgi:hypothetical protein